VRWDVGDKVRNGERIERIVEEQIIRHVLALGLGSGRSIYEEGDILFFRDLVFILLPVDITFFTQRRNVA
jgi:hypothetical protein